MGKKMSAETVKKMSLSRMGAKNPNYGKRCSEETRRRISMALKGKMMGRKLSEETKRKMSVAKKEYWEAKKEVGI